MEKIKQKMKQRLDLDISDTVYFRQGTQEMTFKEITFEVRSE